MGATENPLSLTCFSDVLCIWAHIGQVRADEAMRKFPEQIDLGYRFCSVFGDTAHKIGRGWSERGGYAGFGAHVFESASNYDHIVVHPEIWKNVRPASSTPAHLVIKAVQRVDSDSVEEVLKCMRVAFFESCNDISHWEVLSEIIEAVEVSLDDIRECLHSGKAHADLEADQRDRIAFMVQGSPTYLLNQGRQKLYGNVGYRVLEASIREMLNTPSAGAASWC